MEDDPIFDVITLGETMAAIHKQPESDLYRVSPAGAESNVAIGLAQLGCSTRWVSLLGGDNFGELVHDAIASHGVDVQAPRDARHPTGLMVKEINRGRSRVIYYRSQSAARHMDKGVFAHLAGSRWLHLTGVTPALSASTADLTAAIIQGRSGHNYKVSFDVNYRPGLWPDETTAARCLIDLARHADLVFIGDDEAEQLLGTTDASDIAAQLLRDNQELIVKRGAGAATYIGRTTVSEPAKRVKVVDVTGAGDAFASGYLAADCWGWNPSARLRMGHFMAARVVGSLSDLGPAVDPSKIAALAGSESSQPTSEWSKPK
ncbi:sugar kinase [Arthrobacter globiformis]|uniref:Sugar kinase n=1 Tax=Arthrobacter globiformis TaxID=1665 RepID=A0A328HDQ7_ARTGO|nr:sugar kinase [Arthrobacter globiformis]RAM36738.1 sugar kinase [Arthrobacter globiformis]